MRPCSPPALGGIQMAQVIGMGLTHWPALLVSPHFWPNQIGVTARVGLADAAQVARRDGWPPQMREEWGEDGGVEAAYHHAARLRAGFQTLYQLLTRFAPDVVVIFGDDQTENFLIDGIPPFCVFAGDRYVNRPFIQAGRLYDTKENAWDLPPDTPYEVIGFPEAGIQLLSALAGEGFDVAYALECRSPYGLSHAFVNTAIALQGDPRLGPFPYPVIPIHINCHGKHLFRTSRISPNATKGDWAPPAPTPARCFTLGQAVGRFFAESPWRAVIIGSSSWSHAFLTDKHGGVYPDVETDRQRLAQLQDGRWRQWDALPLAELEDSGEHEFLNWIAMAGAMAALDLSPTVVDFVESQLFASNKCFAYFS